MAGPPVAFYSALTHSKLRLHTIFLAVCFVAIASVANAKSGPFRVCESEACKTLGYEIRSQLYNKDQICSNFYSFVCGGWHLKNPIPRGQLWRNQFKRAEERVVEVFKDVLEDETETDFPLLEYARQFHRVCMNESAIEESGVEPLKRIVQEMGGWPVVEPFKTYSNAKSWRDIDKYYSELRAAPIFYTFETVIENEHHVLKVDMPKFILSPENLLSENHVLLNAYRNMITNTVFRFTTEPMTEQYKSAVSDRVSELIDFEKELAKIVLNNKKGIAKLFTTIGEFQKLYKGKLDLMVRGNTEYFGSCLLLLSRRLIPKHFDSVKQHRCQHEINWLEEIRRVLSIKFSELVHIHTPLIVKNVEYFPKLCRLLEKTPEHVIVTYIHWNFIRSMLQYTDNKTKNILLAASDNLSFDYVERPERWQQCMQENGMIESVHYETLQKHITNEASEKGLDIYSAVDAEVKTGFLKPYIFTGAASQLGLIVHERKRLRYKTPKMYTDLERMNQAYIEEDTPLSYMEQVLSHKRYMARKSAWKIYETVDPDRDMIPWLSEITNQIFEIPKNQTFIDFPAGSLQLPFFDVTLPESYMFGSLGGQLGQKSTEIINLFVERTLSNVLKTLTDKHIECYKQQTYKDYQDEDKMIFIRGSLESLQKQMKHKWSHKIQDALGLEVAFKAYKHRRRTRNYGDVRLPGLEMYNNDQLFFIGFANAFCESPTTLQSSKHAPWYNTRKYSNEAMVNMAIMNNKDFGRVFGCNVGTTMNPAKKCDYWKNISIF